MLSPLLLLLTACESEPDMIEGKVVDVWGNPVEGATVMVVGGNERPMSDTDGRYKIVRPPAGVVQVKAGRHGYIQDHKEVEIGEGANVAAPLFELYPKPTDPGFFIVATGKYLKLEPRPVISVGNALQQFRGVQVLSDIHVETEQPRIVFHTELRHDQLMRLGLELYRLKYVGNAPIPGPLGDTKVSVNLYAADRAHPIEVEPLRSKTDYLIVPKERLPAGVYALQTQGLLTSEQAVFEEVPEELRVVFPFEVR
jgi:hypothetical protein